MQSWRRFCRCNPVSAADPGADFRAAAVNTRRGGPETDPAASPRARSERTPRPRFFSSPGPSPPELGRACRAGAPGRCARPSARASAGAWKSAPLVGRGKQPAPRRAAGAPPQPARRRLGRAHSAERFPCSAPRRVHARSPQHWERTPGPASGQGAPPSDSARRLVQAQGSCFRPSRTARRRWLQAPSSAVAQVPTARPGGFPCRAR